MRRELKDFNNSSSDCKSFRRHKAYPDEKGTERFAVPWTIASLAGHKAYPDEKGTERDLDQLQDLGQLQSQGISR